MSEGDTDGRCRERTHRYILLFFASAAVNVSLMLVQAVCPDDYVSSTRDASIVGLVKHSGSVYRGRLVCRSKCTVGGER